MRGSILLGCAGALMAGMCVSNASAAVYECDFDQIADLTLVKDGGVWSPCQGNKPIGSWDYDLATGDGSYSFGHDSGMILDLWRALGGSEGDVYEQATISFDMVSRGYFAKDGHAWGGMSTYVGNGVDADKEASIIGQESNGWEWAIMGHGGSLGRTPLTAPGHPGKIGFTTSMGFEIQFDANATGEEFKVWVDVGADGGGVYDSETPIVFGNAFAGVGLAGLDYLRFYTSGNGMNFLLDNLVITDTVPTPEPASFAILGLGGLMLMRRRRA